MKEKREYLKEEAIEASIKLSNPKISEGSQQIYGSKKRPPTFEQLYKAAMQMREKKHLDTAKRRLELD